MPANSSLTALEKYWNDGTFKKTLVLRDTSPYCNFDKTYFEFAVPANESSDAEKTEEQARLKLALLKINLLVRLKKLCAWTIDETDLALQILFPKNISQLAITDANFGSHFGNALRTALVYISHLKSLDEQVKVGKGNRRQKFLALWSDLAITGKKPLYSDLFLTRSILKSDPVFDSPVGKYLSYFDSGSSQYVSFSWDPVKPEDPSTGNVSLKSHLPAIQAALNLTADDIEQILVDANKKTDLEPLTLANVSLLYRYGLLAKALKLSINDLITLKVLSGIDPFKAIEPDPITSISQDYPFEQTLRFIEYAKKVSQSGFTLEDLDFISSHSFSPVGKYRFNSDAILVPDEYNCK